LEKYGLEIKKIIREVKKVRAKRVLLQLPDGLKPRAKELTDTLRNRAGVEVLLWGGACFGACDTPPNTGKIRADLLVHFGHSRWNQ